MNSDSQETDRLGAVPGSAWIECAAQLPELGQIVWLYEADRGIWIGSRDDADSEFWLWGNAYAALWHNGKEWDADVEQDDDYQPTHWMPLPELPNAPDETTPDLTTKDHE